MPNFRLFTNQFPDIQGVTFAPDLGGQATSDFPFTAEPDIINRHATNKVLIISRILPFLTDDFLQQMVHTTPKLVHLHEIVGFSADFTPPHQLFFNKLVLPLYLLSLIESYTLS